MSKRKTAPPLNAGKPGITKLTCWRCEKPISGAKTVIEGKYHCPDCCYKHDYPDRVIPESVARTRVPPYEGPSLFDTTGFIRPKRSQERE